MRTLTLNVDPTVIINQLGANSGPRQVSVNVDPYELVQGPLTYNSDGLASTHSVDFTRNPRFAAAWADANRSGAFGADVRWRAYVCVWAAVQAMQHEGDFVEC